MRIIFGSSKRKNRMKLRASIAAFVLAVLAPGASAALIASDQFDYAQGEINGQLGGAGWAGAWTANTGATQVVTPGVALNGSRALQITGNNDNVAYRQLAAAFTGDNLFVSFLVQIDSGSLTANDFVALWLDTVTSGAHTDRPNIGIKADGSGNNDVFVRTNGTGGNFAPEGNIGSGNDVTHQIVGRLSRSVPGNYTRFDLWLDPVLADLATPDASFTGNAGISQITQIGFRSANLDSGDIVLVDDLRLATEWTNVVPEPASVALLGLGLVGLGFARRRR
ncbi:MAG: PEP-CTERM sorting domain-containing protein [Betaproteobacteria bacterium]|nr:MAG: PEP-CTERM sorting domain-containing protein [Betaproteobacteria bacterium]